MNQLNSKMIDTYYELIKAGKRTDVPDIVPQEVKDGVQALLDKDAQEAE